MPYARFQEVDHKFRALEAEHNALKAQLAGNQQSMQQQVQDQVAKVRSETSLRVGLARAGVVSDAYADFLVAQYQGLGQQAPTADAWIASKKTAEPAFFGQLGVPPSPQPAPPAPAPAPPVAVPPAPPPTAAPPARGNPDTGTVTVPGNPTQDPPLTLELIDKMDTATYARRRSEIRKFIGEQRR